jgi:predicted nucleotidyltransferase
MPNLFTKKLDLSLIIPLMESHQVQKAYLFGSMGTDQFNPKKSDFDILVEIDESNPLTKG